MATKKLSKHTGNSIVFNQKVIKDVSQHVLSWVKESHTPFYGPSKSSSISNLSPAAKFVIKKSLNDTQEGAN